MAKLWAATLKKTIVTSPTQKCFTRDLKKQDAQRSFISSPPFQSRNLAAHHQTKRRPVLSVRRQIFRPTSSCWHRSWDRDDVGWEENPQNDASDKGSLELMRKVWGWNKNAPLITWLICRSGKQFGQPKMYYCRPLEIYFKVFVCKSQQVTLTYEKNP